MSLTLKFEHPHFPADQEFGINHLGIVKNGSMLELGEDAERMFVANNGMTVEDAFQGNGIVTVSGSSSLNRDETDQLIAAFNPPTEEGLAAGEVLAPSQDEGAQNDEEAKTLILGEGENENA